MTLYRLSVVVICLLLTSCAARKGSSDLDVAEPSPADVYTRLGIEYMDRGQLDLALENFRHALDLDSRSSEAHHAIAILYRQLEQQHLAAGHLEKAVALRPTNASAQTDHASFLCSKGEYAKAKKHFDIAINTPLYKRPWVAMANAGICAQKAGKIDEAESYLRKALEKQPTFAPALLAMTRISVAKDKAMSGRAFLQRYQSVAKDTAESLALGIEIESELGDQSAVDNYRSELLEKFPDSAEAAAISK